MSLSLSALFILTLIFTACKKEDILIRDPDILENINTMLETQRTLTEGSQIPIWNIFSEPLSDNERQALKFIYAGMPLCDIADYPPSFFLAIVRQSLRAREDYNWCRREPEDIFLHYVLPVRVNNENPDSFRLVMYDEIHHRIRGLSMEEAALEINHWCHEKVTYKGTDARTSAPLSTLKKTFGRCGEESVFTVAALRTAGIPARQVYVPRWAHVDDNHAWVEVWINGKWHYMGACEPEPVLDFAWFTEPSARTMMVHTYVYGGSPEKEEVISVSGAYEEINLTKRYAAVKKITVVATDTAKRPIQNARVEFSLYNYAEFFPIATLNTDKRGMAQLTTGFGDLMIWASGDSLFDYRMATVAIADTIRLTLNKHYVSDHSESYDLIAPQGIKINSRITQRESESNSIRLIRENVKRNARMAAFKGDPWADSLAERTLLNCDTIGHVMARSFGNWREMTSFIEKNATRYHSFVLPFLASLSEKDFSDAREAVLSDHLENCIHQDFIPRDVFEKWVLSPRIRFENLTPWRSFLQKKMIGITDNRKLNVTALINWINNNIAVTAESHHNPETTMSPAGVYNLRIADPDSRNMFFVACCRTFGVPARLDSLYGMPEYYTSGTWQKAILDSDMKGGGAKGTLHFSETRNPFMPLYYIHFTISRLTKGHYKTLKFPEGMKLSDFPSSVSLDTGRYLLITGNRLQNGGVLTSLTYFTIHRNKMTSVPVFIRLIPEVTMPVGRINLDNLLLSVPGDGSPHNLTMLASGKKLIILLVDPDQEPSRHVLNEIRTYADHFALWDGKFVMAMPRNKSTIVSVLQPHNLPGENVQGIDINNNICKAFESLTGEKLSEKLPLVALADQDGFVYLFSAGYKIGLGEQLLKFTH